MFSILVILLVIPFLFRHIALPRGVLKRGEYFSLTYTKFEPDNATCISVLEVEQED
jgi:hypothetical protein